MPKTKKVKKSKKAAKSVQASKAAAASPDESVSDESVADELAASQAPLSEHLAELRKRLAIALASFAVGFVVAFIFAGQIFDFLLLPYERASGDARAIRLIYTAPQEFFLTQVKLSFFGAFVLSFPVMAQQLYRFVAPGLYRHERRAFLPFLLAAPILFVAGAALVYYAIMPLALGFFLSMEMVDTARAIEMVPKVSEYLGLITALMLAFGLCFQLPVVMALLARAGLVSAAGLAAGRKYAVVAIFALAAILTPPDIISQIGLAVPVLLLYEVAIVAARRMEKRKQN